METTVQTLAEFVLERLAEEEATDSRWRNFEPAGADRAIGEAERAEVSADQAWLDARVLAECEAKRQIVAAHPSYGGYGERCATCYASDELTGDPWPCETLRALASVWADHAAYRPEWRP